MRPLRLLHIHQNSQVGGIQQQILGLMRAYDRGAVEPEFCCFGPLGEIGREIESLGVACHALGRASYNRFSPPIVRDIARIMRERRIDIVRTHKYRASLHGLPAARLAGVPVRVASVHGNYRKDLRLNRRIANRLVLRLADRVVAVSDAIRADILRYEGLPPERVLLMRNGVDTDRFSPEAARRDLRAELGISPDDRVAGFIGRIAAVKGLGQAIEAVGVLSATHPDLKLLVVGEGSLREEFEGSTVRMGLAGKVVFAGARRDIPEVLAAMDVFLMPSLAEGLPNALLEAMSMARPIVATAVGGIPEVVRDGETGLLVPPADPEALARALGRLLGDPGGARRMGLRARALVEGEFGMAATARRWEALYLDLFMQKGRATGYNIHP